MSCSELEAKDPVLLISNTQCKRNKAHKALSSKNNKINLQKCTQSPCALTKETDVQNP